MVELAKLLQRHHFSITILLTAGFLDHPSIDTYIHRVSASHPSISFRRLPLTAAPTAPAFHANYFSFMKRNALSVATALTQISQSATVRAFVIDCFCTSAMEPASSMGIPVYCFFPSSAAGLAVGSYFPKLHRQTTASFKDMVGVELHVPGNAPLKAANLPEPMLDRDDPAYWDMLDFCTRLPSVRGIIVNSFPELEPAAVKAVAEGVCFPDPNRAPPVYYVGPLIAEPQQYCQSDVATDSKQCLSWLDEQPSRSVGVPMFWKPWIVLIVTVEGDCQVD
ncbi:UDP-glycosyltransferase 88A1 [Spatholobus suberectus]|nr:UDP-glycosyltransferase 88A1 [Spatholobus suberectus]